MSFLNGLFDLMASLSETRRMSHLLSLSDRELCRRGLDRDRLARNYIQSLGAR